MNIERHYATPEPSPPKPEHVGTTIHLTADEHYALKGALSKIYQYGNLTYDLHEALS